MRKPRPRDIRQRVLDQRGLEPTRLAPRRHRHLTKSVDRSSQQKSWAMLALEREFNLPIDELLTIPGSVRELTKRLGIAPSTVCKMRRRRGIDGTKDTG